MITKSEFETLFGIYEQVLGKPITSSVVTTTSIPQVTNTANHIEITYPVSIDAYKIIEFHLFRYAVGTKDEDIQAFAEYLTKSPTFAEFTPNFIVNLTICVDNIRVLSIINKVYPGVHSILTGFIEQSSGISKILYSIYGNYITPNIPTPAKNVLKNILLKVKNKPFKASLAVSKLLLHFLKNDDTLSPQDKSKAGSKLNASGSTQKSTSAKQLAEMVEDAEAAIQEEADSSDSSQGNKEGLGSPLEEEFKKELEKIVNKIQSSKSNPLQLAYNKEVIKKANSWNALKSTTAIRKLQEAFSLVKRQKLAKTADSGVGIDMINLIQEVVVPSGLPVFKDMQAQTGFHLYILIDSSSSMSHNLHKALAAAYTLYHACDKRWVIPHIYTFSSSGGKAHIRDLNSLSVPKNKTPVLSTQVGTPLYESLLCMRDEMKNTAGSKHLIVLTDGKPADKNGEYSSIASENIRKLGIPVTGVFVGNTDALTKKIFDCVFKENWSVYNDNFDTKFFNILRKVAFTGFSKK